MSPHNENKKDILKRQASVFVNPLTQHDKRLQCNLENMLEHVQTSAASMYFLNNATPAGRKTDKYLESLHK